MANLVQVSDIATYMDKEFTNVQTDAAQMVLDGLEGELEAYLGRPVTVQTFTDETHVVPAHHEPVNYGSFFQRAGEGNAAETGVATVLSNYILYPQNTPIVSVSSLNIRPQSSNPSITTLTEGDDFFVRSFGIEVPRATGGDIITFTYDAGLPAKHASTLKLLILRAASRELTNMTDDAVGLKDLNTTDSVPGVPGFTDNELRSVRKLRRISAVAGLN